MTTQNTSALAGTRHHVTLYIDQQAACLAGYDQYGKLERHINPSELTDRQRQTLVKLNFAIGSDQVGFPIDGSHSIETLLDAAADKLDAKQAKRAIEDAETIDKMKQRILTAPLTDIIDIDEASGQVSIKRAADTALLHLSGDRDALKRMWLDQYGIWYSPASGSSARAEAIRAAVLADSDVSARILAAEEACSLLTKRLDAAKLRRQTLNQAERAAKEQAEADRQIRRQAQLTAFVTDNLHDLAQRKFAAGLLPESYLMAAMTGKALGFLDVFQAFESVLFDGIAREYCLDQLPGGVYAAELVREERRLEQLDDAAFLRLLALTDAVKAQYPDAVIESFLLVGFLNIFDKLNDPEYRLPVARVTVTVGEFQLSRECALSDSWEG